MLNAHTARIELAPEVGELTRLARDSLGHMTAEQNSSGEVAVIERFSVRHGERTAWLLPATLGVLATTAATVFVLRHRAESAPLSYVIENQSSSDGRSLDVISGVPQTVRFSDGTEVRVDQGTQARIRLVTKHGAELALSRGALHAAVIHSATSEWRFDAGPFVVHVTGTTFALAWDPELDRFDLRLERGSVTVNSPVVNAPISVHTGQWLTIRPRSNEVFIRNLTTTVVSDDAEPAHESEGPSAAPPSVRPSSASGASPEPPARAPNSTPETGHRWARDLLEGRAERIVDDAFRRGLEACLVESSPSELAALADAARYTRRNDVARLALLAERRRFPGTSTAAEAALLLGRLDEAQQGDSQALSWFDTYLAEAPAGAHASEALGRKMAIVRHSAGAVPARAIAEEYLAKYPDGTFSSAARAILKSP